MSAQEKPKAVQVDDFIRDELVPQHRPESAAQHALRNVFKVPGA